ncbi:MAG TPA: hypothetical protein VH478_20625 [Trebonia sp.]|jgi:hypothetical protein|nr:hypothetical protein [Trebonia sp.]
MPRTITTDTGVTFEVTRELAANIGGDPTIKEKDRKLGYVTTGQAGNITVYELRSPKITFTGAITVSHSPDGELAKWQIGMAQNVIEMSRKASYGLPDGAKTAEIREVFQFPPPLRDGGTVSLPFDADPVDLALGEVAVEDSDDPNWLVPKQIDAGRPLFGTSSRLRLATWMMLARTEAPRQVILLGRVDWTVDLSTQINGQKLGYTAGHVTRVDGTTQLNAHYSAPNLPADLNTAPDLRDDIDLDEYGQGLLLVDGKEGRTWVYEDDGDEAVAWRERDDPAGCPNWLSGQ